MNNELRIIRDGEAGAELINRHRWVSYALQTPALQRCDDKPWHAPRPDEPDNGPVFGLKSIGNSQPAPYLYWLDGQVIVRDVGDGWLPELRSIATRLQGRLMKPGDGAA